MSILAEVFVKYWEEVIVAVLLTATLPFIRGYVRRQRAKVLGFLREKERLKEALLDEEEKRRRTEELLEQERKAREEAERKLETEVEKKKKAQSEVDSMRVTFKQERAVRENLECKLEVATKEKLKHQANILEAWQAAYKFRALLAQEQKAHEETKRKLQAETEARRKAQQEAGSLRATLAQERKAREELERRCQAEIDEKQKAQSEAEEKRKTSQVDWNALLSELGKILPPRPHEDRVYIPQNRILWIDEHIELTNLTKLTERLLRVVDLYVFSLKYDKENASKVANAERMAVLTYLAVYIAKCKCDGKSELDIINDSGVKEVLDRVCATKKDLELFLTDKATTQNMMQFIGEASSHVEKEFKI